MCPRTHGCVYTIVMVLQSLFSLSVKVPRNATALKRWTLMHRRWQRKEDSLGSPVDRVRSRARSEIKSMPVLLMGPNVSRARGMKTCVLESSWYLAVFWLRLLSPLHLLWLMYWQDMMLLGCPRPWHPRPSCGPL